MICENCAFVEKTSSTDEHGNIHVVWQCKETLRLVFSQIIYSARFLEDLRSGRLYAPNFYEAGWLPSDKTVHELKHVEVLAFRKTKTCKRHRVKMKSLMEY